MIRVREREKINIRRKRFALIPCQENDGCMTVVDRDAEPLWSVEKDGRHVARVVREYARALVDVMNFCNTDHNHFLALQPAKRKKKQRQHELNLIG